MTSAQVEAKVGLTRWLKPLVDGRAVEEPLILILSQVTNLRRLETVEEIDFDWARQTIDECVDDILMAAFEDLEGGNFKADVTYSVSVEGLKSRHDFALRAQRQCKDVVIRLRVDSAQKEALTAAAARSGLSLSSWIRMVTLKKAKATSLPTG